MSAAIVAAAFVSASPAARPVPDRASSRRVLRSAPAEIVPISVLAMLSRFQARFVFVGKRRRRSLFPVQSCDVNAARRRRTAVLLRASVSERVRHHEDFRRPAVHSDSCLAEPRMPVLF
jgi:hypothetical protein